jgi:hypothetical protein
MKNTHIEHPEDLILDGKDAALNVINFLEFIYEGDAGNMASVKYDGAPAVVFGTNPENGKFFVGTKSVFNKKTPKINYTVEDIRANHESENLRNVLTLCLMYLPKVNGIFQGDFMGVGNGNVAITPNTITYKFLKPIDEQIVFALHTQYRGDTIATAVSEPYNAVWHCNDVKFLSVNASYIQPSNNFLKVYANHARYLMEDIDFPEFKTKVAKANVKKTINSYIREGKELNVFNLADDTGIDWKLFALYNLIITMKNVAAESYFAREMCVCLIGDELAKHEGIVVKNCYGTFKIVDRQQFSRANFNNGRFATAS